MNFRINIILQNTIIKNGILFTFFSFLNNGINFLLLLILAGFLTPSDYGELNLFNTLVLLVSILITLNVESFFTVSFFKESFKSIRQILNIIFLIGIFFITILSLGIVIFQDSLNVLIGLKAQYQWLALMICFFQVFNNIVLAIWRLEEKPIKYGIFSMGVVIANFILTLLLIILFHYGWLGRVYAQFIATFLFFTISLYILIKKKYLLKIKPTKHLLQKSLAFSVPLIPHSISGWLRMGMDRYIVNFFYGAAQVGFFSFAFNFSGVLNIIGASFNATHSVQIYKALANQQEDTKQQLYKQTKWMIVFYIGVAVIVYLLSSFFIPIIVPKYNESVAFLFPLCMAGMFQCVYYLFVNYLFYFDKTKELMYITFGVAIIHFGLSLLLTRYSLLFTAYITMFTNALVCLAVMFYSNKIYSLKKNL